jgi:predicted RNase H-like nuclease (RuvC/YqgF family)
MRGMVVGIDPGTTSGVAALDLDGKLIGFKSAKHFKGSQIREYISDLGDPVVVATDVSPAPASVSRISGAFRSVLFVPEKCIGVLEKQGVVSVFLADYPDKEIKNHHERDALAAALLAYNSYRNKFRQCDRKVEEAGLSDVRDEIKKAVVAGIPMDLAIKRLKKEHSAVQK